MRFKLQKYKDCQECEGSGYVDEVLKASFSVNSMELVDCYEKITCPKCLERSKYEYDCHLDRKNWRGDER